MSDVSIEDFVSIINVELIVILVIISVCKRGRKIVWVRCGMCTCVHVHIPVCVGKKVNPSTAS